MCCVKRCSDVSWLWYTCVDILPSAVTNTRWSVERSTSVALFFQSSDLVAQGVPLWTFRQLVPYIGAGDLINPVTL